MSTTIEEMGAVQNWGNRSKSPTEVGLCGGPQPEGRPAPSVCIGGRRPSLRRKAPPEPEFMMLLAKSIKLQVEVPQSEIAELWQV